MRDNPTEAMEKCRVITGPYASPPKSGCQGAYLVYEPAMLKIICSDGKDEKAENFEHVSVSLRNRTPTWAEMVWVKNQFWLPEEACFQLHPAVKDYVNHHPYCLHIWRHRILPPPMPSINLVGPKR